MADGAPQEGEAANGGAADGHRISDAHRRMLERRARRREAFAPPLVGTKRRLAAWTNMLLNDHGVFRMVYLNLHAIAPGAWRSAQPAPHHIRRVARLGVKTVVNLRAGREFGSYPLERDACDAAGLAYAEIKLRSRAAPSKETLEEAAALFDRIEYPVLYHCKSGADRAGLMSALHLILREGAAGADASRMLSFRFGHVRQSATGILDAFLASYAAAEAAAPDGRRDFLDWVRNDYDPEALTHAFKSRGWADLLTDRVLGRE